MLHPRRSLCLLLAISLVACRVDQRAAAPVSQADTLSRMAQEQSSEISSVPPASERSVTRPDSVCSTLAQVLEERFKTEAQTGASPAHVEHPLTGASLSGCRIDVEVSTPGTSEGPDAILLQEFLSRGWVQDLEFDASGAEVESGAVRKDSLTCFWTVLWLEDELDAEAGAEGSGSAATSEPARSQVTVGCTRL